MGLFEKIQVIYPDITTNDVSPSTGTISLRKDDDVIGWYIERWEHPTLAQPTQEQLNAVEAP